jgi:predicted NAD-dependent protein-ADP-ribosyltransferase YbiA (DUF1768 family)
MIQSKISTNVSYKEDEAIDSEDVGHEANPYEMELFNKEVVIVFGKPKYTKMQYNIVFFPMYLVVNQSISAQIGIIEIPKNKVITLLNDTGELDVDNIEDPLLFSFVNEHFIDRMGSSVNQFDEMESSKEDPTEDHIDELQEIDFETDDHDVLRVSVPKKSLSRELEKASTILNKGVFKIIADHKQPASLLEETEEDAKQNKRNFTSSTRNTWIEKFMKNNHYAIHQVESNGDCLFAVIRDAFKQVGYYTTVDKLRAIVAKDATQTIFDEHRQLYMDLDATVREYDHEMKTIKKQIEVDFKKRAKIMVQNKENMTLLLETIQFMKERYVELKEMKTEIQNLISESVSDFSKIDTLEKFREYIQTPQFWADNWAIAVLERELQIKMIILSQRAFLDDDLDSVLMCGEIDVQLQKQNRFEPKYYIMTTFSGNHFELITYKHKRILEFHEIPYHVKSLIVNKCMEKSSGPFSIIPSFQDLQERMGIQIDKSDPDIEKEDHEYDSTTVFAFHPKSSNTPKPGKGVQEQITKTNQPLYVNLSKHKDWRKKLDDTWTEHIFEIDGHKYASVEHYYQGSKFKKRNPDFMLQFSLDSNSKISKDIDLAQSAGSKSGKLSKKAKTKVKQDILLRPVEVTIDPDFYGERSQQERLDGIRAKFSQNDDLKHILLATNDAKLIQFKRGSPAESDLVLMAVRRHLDI